MNMHTCPHCNRPGISGLRRAFLGPAHPAVCSICGERVGVPWWSTFLVLPMVGCLCAVTLTIDDKVWIALLTMLGTAITFTLWTVMVPLVRR